MSTYQVSFTMRQLLEAGVHYGHRKNLWNPKMAPYIYGVRNGIHIINLQETFVLLHIALTAMKNMAAQNCKILFVGTKNQASDIIAEHAKKCGQYYVNHRWLGGMLTNWGTISESINTLQEYEKTLADENSILNKKEKLALTRKAEKLEKTLGGIRSIGGLPDMIFIIDTNKQDIAIKEANKLNIPIVAIVDSNCSLAGIKYIIPGNDDAKKSIDLYCNLASDAILAGIQESLIKAGCDIGATDNLTSNSNTIELAITPENIATNIQPAEAIQEN